ncbi:conserved Plasmodium protein, unknown function [Plasmodium berghei]|uniref:DUF4536 domain-containing protein n=2 Tax=Plasmodium berghei TaxID=5821 RepID=A0A509ALX8_PLABA|nr:conserved Plasmodium protein, unknown function [Plasmodium berghei ANKA]CXI43843.1 conserved Plasmodium protein, unknown function [Plasmodium berghei]SCM22407.1 conserved Plasmodium protein, unknown function [Plasmodium berghei]SCN25429.1 conserved Plasmodium protein, unknown function [Plasmodium berghei]SCO60401.1 conserved Plasmodium protein, unknown function [Plasmodium berghei]SCO62171.1 conserved Plasmodium protein, unknown function [Plasmodium berghei]|eukprot:XP_034421625.1 conserved Plasmodium protein, unknown function [Plasmodium berghei ANKA]
MSISSTKNKDDCIFCRVTGTVLFGGVSFYSFLKFLQAKKKTGDKFFFGFMFACFGILSIYRASTPAKSIIQKTKKEEN